MVVDATPVQLAQIMPTDTNVTLAATKPAKEKWLVTSINICHHGSSNHVYTIYVDQDGTTQDHTTAIAANVTMSANTVVLHEWVHGLAMNKGTAAGHIYVQSDAANCMTFTICGIRHS